MKKIVNSERFQDITFELYEKINEEGNPLYIVRHADLMDAIVNRLPKGYNCKYNFEQIQVLGNMHFLVKATIEDNETRIVEYGEVCPDTLTTTIAKQYPATMAMNRAFDRAAIRYFNMKKRVYSDNEINPSSLKDAPVTENTSPTATTPVPAVTTTASTTAQTATKAPGFDDVDTSVPSPGEDAKETTQQTVSKENDRLTQLAAVKVGILKHANLTLEECLAKDKNSLVWIAQKVTSGVNLERANLIREYLTLKNIAY